MKVVCLVGSRGKELLQPIMRKLSSRGYRSAVVNRVSREPSHNLEGAGILCLLGRRHAQITQRCEVFNVEELVNLVSRSSQIPPDYIVLVGLDDWISRREDVIKVGKASSAKEVRSLKLRFSKPILVLCEEEGDFKSEKELLESLLSIRIDFRMRFPVTPETKASTSS